MSEKNFIESWREWAETTTPMSESLCAPHITSQSKSQAESIKKAPADENSDDSELGVYNYYPSPY